MSFGRGALRGILGTMVAAAGLAACSSGAAPDETLAECLDAAGVTGAAVGIRGFAFWPATLTVSPGTRVTWVNCEAPGVEAHTATADDGTWGSQLMSAGGTFSRDFNDVGSFPYHCTPHPVMRATIIVQPGG
jgi:plastocyanin